MCFFLPSFVAATPMALFTDQSGVISILIRRRVISTCGRN